MGAWKRLNQQDAYVTTYVAKKSWDVSGEQDYVDNKIEIYDARSGSQQEYYLDSGDLTATIGVSDGEYDKLVWRSLHKLYYSNYDRSTGGIEATGSYFNYEESSLATGSRYLLDSASVISLPRDIIGTHIEPKSFSFELGSGTAPHLVDDGEGFLRYDNRETGDIRGVIIYSHGLAIVNSDTDTVDSVADGTYRQIEWKSNQPIYTYNYNIKLSDYEFNHTLNPTAQSGSDGKAADLATGSYFQPYITSVGLYNDANELIAVAKLSKPLPKSRHTETVIKVRLDM